MQQLQFSNGPGYLAIVPPGDAILPLYNLARAAPSREHKATERDLNANILVAKVYAWKPIGS